MKSKLTLDNKNTKRDVLDGNTIFKSGLINNMNHTRAKNLILKLSRFAKFRLLYGILRCLNIWTRTYENNIS